MDYYKYIFIVLSAFSLSSKDLEEVPPTEEHVARMVAARTAQNPSGATTDDDEDEDPIPQPVPLGQERFRPLAGPAPLFHVPHDQTVIVDDREEDDAPVYSDSDETEDESEQDTDDISR